MYSVTNMSGTATVCLRCSTQGSLRCLCHLWGFPQLVNDTLIHCSTWHTRVSLSTQSTCKAPPVTEEHNHPVRGQIPQLSHCGAGPSDQLKISCFHIERAPASQTQVWHLASSLMYFTTWSIPISKSYCVWCQSTQCVQITSTVHSMCPLIQSHHVSALQQCCSHTDTVPAAPVGSVRRQRHHRAACLHLSQLVAVARIQAAQLVAPC